MADDEPTSSGPLFEGVVFSTIPSPEFDPERKNNVISTMAMDGGTYIELRDDDQSLDRIEEITHVISTHVDFPQYHECLQRGINVVKPSWVRACCSKRKRTSPRQHSPDPSQYFGDVILAFGDIPDGDREAITAGVIALGGQPSQKMTKLVTHVVSTSMDNDVCRVVESRKLSCFVVLPHWFDACVKLGKKINEKPYLLPDPEILRQDNGPVKPSSTPQLRDATTADTKEIGERILMNEHPSPSKSRKGLAALKVKKIYFADDMELSARLQETLYSLVDSAGGEIVESVGDCDIYIGCFRDGQGYIEASQAGKEVANLAWLYHVININSYVSPLNKLLHYPVPRYGLPGFENMKISLSNYSGEARIYIENLIRHSGAEYTKTMKQDNTHLITAHMGGEKCEAAQEWNINIVNHLWLEESYAKCSIQSHSNPRYSQFPSRTNLGEITGQTSVDMKSVERAFFPRPKSPQKPKVKARTATRQAVPASSAVANMHHAADDMELDMPLPVVEADGEDSDAEAAPPATVKKGRGRPRKSDVVATPHVRNEKENESPMLTSTGRASKVKALVNLHGMAPDIALFQKEQKRKGGVVHGGPRNADEMSSPGPRASKKRPSDEYDATAQGSDLSDGETQEPTAKQNKKAKTSNTPTLPPIRYRMMVTGDDRWADNGKKESIDKATLRQLGVLLTQDPKEVDILVAPKILRTKKFVCALSGAPRIVDSTFLDTALSKKKLVDNPQLLKDRDGEERNGFKLAEAVERARKNKRNLFRGWSIYVTKDIKGGFETFKDIITLNGGTALLYTGRTGIKLADRRVEQDSADVGEESENQGGADEMGNVYLVSGESDGEMKLWKTFRTVAKKQELEPRVVHSDWLLNAALSQEIVWKEGWELDEEKVMSQRAG